MNSNIILKPDYSADPYISLVASPFDSVDIKDVSVKPYRMPRIMCPMAQLYVASLTVVGLFIVFRLSLK